MLTKRSTDSSWGHLAMPVYVDVQGGGYGSQTRRSFGGAPGWGGAGSCPSRSEGCLIDTCTLCGQETDFKRAKYGSRGSDGDPGTHGNMPLSGKPGADGLLDLQGAALGASSGGKR